MTADREDQDLIEESALETESAIGPHLREEIAEDLEARDWSQFTAKVLERIDAEVVELESLSPKLQSALAEDHARGLVDVDWAKLSASVMTQIEAELESELDSAFDLGGLLRSDAELEMSSRAGTWTAMAEGSLHQARLDAIREEKQPLDARVIDESRRAVAAELEAIEPRFERQFRAELERRIEADAAQSMGARLQAWWHKQMESWRAGAGFAAAAAAIFLLLIVSPRIEPDAPVTLVVNQTDPGRVVVEEVSFDGNVMVMEGEGVTFVYLSDS